MLDSSPNFQLIELDAVTSTNTFLAAYQPQQGTDLTLVTAEYQTAGRGQTGNTWESERGKNLLFSLLLRPSFLPPTHLFLLSEAIALAIRNAVDSFLGNPQFPFETNASATPCHPAVSVKWPNDIYVGDRKIGGILMENEFSGSHIGRCIIGCGVNINQADFHSDAPNPVSLRQLLGHDTTRMLVLDTIITQFRHYYADIQASFAASTSAQDQTASLTSSLHTAYRSFLYRREGLHPYLDTSSPTPFLAEIADVEPSGHLLLRDTSGHIHRYAFKEVSFVV